MTFLDKLLNRQPAVITAQSWQGNWDPDPIFYTLFHPSGGEIQSLPEDYLGLPLPRKAGDFTFIGSNLPWRGLDVHIDVPNTERASLVSEYWDGITWHRTNLDKTHRDYATLNRDGKILCCPEEYVWREKAVNKQPALWIRFSVTANLSPVVSGWADIIHNAPILVSANWTLKKHRFTACENRPGRKMIYVQVFDVDSEPIYKAEVSIDTEPSYGIIYDHPDFWGLTDENGYIEWDHLGVPTVYGLSIDFEPIVENIRTDLGNEYCGTGIGSWRPVNRYGIYSYWLELQQKNNQD